jgi:hypothetical protein
MGTTYWPKDDLTGNTSIRFAPMTLLGVGGTPNATDVLNGWNTWYEPHYRGWINPNIGEKSGFMLHVVGPSLFTDDVRPSDATDPNDSGYDWSKFDAIMNLNILTRDEVVMGWLWRLETSSGSLYPNWWPEDWSYAPPNETRKVPDWSNPAVLQFMKDLMTAIGAKYNDNTNMYFWGFSEQNGVPQEQNAQQEEFIRHGIEQLSKCMCLVMQSPDVYIRVNDDIHVGKIFSGPNAFRAGCGSDNFPTYDCGDPNAGYIQQFNSMIPNPPGGRRRVSALSQESNEFRIITSTHTPIDSPWGADTLFPLDSERFINSNISPAVVVWYCSYKPRASGAAANAGLGWDGGADPAGVVPCNILVHGTLGLRMTGIESKEYDRAYRLFGANGTRAALYPPVGFSAGGAPPAALPYISDAGDESYYDGETGVDIDGGNFEATQGTGWVRIYGNNTGTGSYATQTVTAWADDQITITIDQGSLNDGANYLFVHNDSDDTSGSYQIFFQSTSAQPIIQNLSDNSVANGQTNVIVSGTNFNASQNNGFVEINSTSDGSGISAIQTISNWSDTTITFNVNAGGLTLGASYYLFVHDSSNNLSNGVSIFLEDTVIPTGPIITGVSDGDIYHQENNVTIDGSGFGIRGNAFVTLNSASDGSGTSATQEILNWSDTQIGINVNIGGIPDSTNAYMLVTTNAGIQSNGYPVLVRANIGPDIFISSVSPTNVYDGLLPVDIEGTGFGVYISGSSRIECTPRGNFSIVQAQSLFQTSWTDSFIRITFVRGNLVAGDIDIYVINSSGYRSAAYPLTLITQTGTPIITQITTLGLHHDEVNVPVYGANFNAQTSASEVIIWQDKAKTKGAVQPITSWGDTVIVFTVSLLDLVFETRTGYLTVTNSEGLTSELFTVQIEGEDFESFIIDNADLGYVDTAGFSNV